ncbi:MAG: hypothetical protein IKT56_05990 [Clostridia bacterium]|nr:hypothetical protein [Clostridia bacterium]
MNLREEIIKVAKAEAADLVGFAPASRFGADDPIFKIFPEVKTVICLVFRVLRGVYRGIEEGTTYYQFPTMGCETMEETVMPIASLKVCNLIESEGHMALPQRRHYTITSDKDDTNPEAQNEAIFRGRDKEIHMNFEDSAVLCGVGERGFYGALLTDEFGPMVKYCFVLTDAELEADDVKEAHLCDKCGKCVKGCPGNAIDAESGKLDRWRCAVYYDGACGLKNPFMAPDAFPDFENRLDIIAGTAKIDRALAEKIIDSNVFYPAIMQGYQACMCGRSCDMECYVHLEEKGALTKSFKTPFRKREPWKFNIEDFEA